MKALFHNICGPTTVHLQHEGYLLVSLILLTIASFQSIYKESFGLKGDIIFCTLTTLWLSRYIITRWICTWDTSTSAMPTVRGVLAHWITSHIMAGQYCDRPSPQVLAKQGMGAPRVEEDGRTAALSTFVMPSILYSWNFVRVRFLFPLLRKREQLETSRSHGAALDTTSPRSLEEKAILHHQQQQQQSSKRRDRESSSHHQRIHPYMHNLLVVWNKVNGILGPVLQMSIPACTLLYYTWRLPFTKYILAWKTTKGGSRFDAMMGESEWNYGYYYGAFDTTNAETPSWSEVLFVISFPTVASLLVFSRLINPIPDLVAGSNVLKAVRTEAKTHGSISSKSSKSKLQKENQDGPWAEQNTSIVAQNRLRLIVCVVLLRILENFFIAVFLPWTGYACRASGHCQEGIQLWQLSTIIFPVGITSSLRRDGNPSNDFDINSDFYAALLAGISAIIITGILLLAQAVTLNGSYLAITGYICGEWTLVDPQKDPSLKNAVVTPSQWDPKRRYKKGDLIVLNRSFWFPRQVFYKATSNSPEGRPFDPFLRATHDMFRNELGQSSTSTLLTLAIKGHLFFIAVLFVIVLGNTLVRGSNSNGMLMTLLANLVACFGAINVGLPNRSELRMLSEAIQH